MFPCTKKLSNKTSHAGEKLSLMRAIKPFYITMSLLGLFPYSVKSPKDKQSVTLIRKSFYFNCVSCVCVNLIIIPFYILHIQQVLAYTERNSMTEVLMTQINYILELSNLIFVCIVSYVCAFRNRFTYVNIFNKIISSCKQFLDRDKNALFRYLQDQVKLVIGSLCVILICQLTMNFTRDDGMWKVTLVTLTFIVPQMIQFIVIGFYCIMVFTVVAILKIINQEIGKPGRVIMSDTIKVERTISLRQLEHIFAEVIEVKRQINEAIQAAIFVTVLQSFHSLVSEAHIIYHGSVLDRTLPTHDAIHCLTWIVYQLLKLYAISYAGDLFKLEVRKIGRTLCNIPSNKLDARLLLDVQHFSTLISHQSEGLWHVYDYIPLDYTLIFNIIASAVMYLTVLVQFDKQIC